MAIHIRVTPKIDDMINEISSKRKENHDFNKSKKDVVAEAITVLYKREIKCKV